MISSSIHQLRQLPRFAELQDDVLEWIAVRSEEIIISKNYKIFKEDELAEYVFTIKRGKVKLSKTNSDGNECVVHVMVSGETFSELGLGESPFYFLTAESLTECSILKIKRADHTALLKNSPSLALWSLKDLSFLARSMCLFIQDLGLNDVETRLARLLLRVGDRVGPGSDFLEVQFSRKEIAAILCARPETISRTIGDWIKKGVVDQSLNGLRVSREFVKKLNDCSAEPQPSEQHNKRRG